MTRRITILTGLAGVLIGYCGSATIREHVASSGIPENPGHLVCQRDGELSFVSPEFASVFRAEYGWVMLGDGLLTGVGYYQQRQGEFCFVQEPVNG